VAGGGWVRWRMAGGGVLVVEKEMSGSGMGLFGFREERGGGGTEGAVRL
jgi:hypothetical protein